MRRGPFAAAQEANLLCLQRWYEHVVEDAVLLVDDAAHPVQNLAQQFGRREIVWTGLDRAEFGHLLDPGHANLEELIEVGAGDAQEAQPLQQRYPLVERLREHPPVELQQ